ncbi:cellulose synthase complex periplasmic endoglucanase BcsZ [Xylophilus sp. GOD-11R]|uniref:cellulose synthase complex periplasmic endoglucanase BcsZ n=1 Tax=Xylophilus sp. GOD-11R TaxID=3089814 RepID=UPI00298D4690|nr:cellulose synthase complex periplasmic endoglucanase BcsZ [Xylophilus sp. GOD-11R]WPB56947.1 cellulose synthase complex periplasmic endoglucanase BcsZ [Xylophilus sp. GOD-11R]
MMRRDCLTLLSAAAVAPAWGAPGCDARWPLWDAFVTHFVQADGRVIDASTPQKHSSSEGQSYGMFFALVANDRPRFDALWRWSVDNLMGGQVQGRLPAWWWGLAPDNSWRVLDGNSASDADLWFTYALLEAARLWKQPAYERDARLLLAEIEKREVVAVPGLGPMLMPGEFGFVHHNPERWYFNPSYQPPPVLRRLVSASPVGPWGAIARNTETIFQDVTAPSGFAPDWTAFTLDATGKGAFGPHPEKQDVGSYDAIRTYLWAGVTPPSDSLAQPLRTALAGQVRATVAAGQPPESVTVSTGAMRGTGSFGFSAAMLPLLASANAPAALARQRQRVADGLQQALSPQAVQQRQPPYYDLVLTLFGQGWLDGRYQFTRSGALAPAWTSPCRATPVH